MYAGMKHPSISLAILFALVVAKELLVRISTSP